ncbi:MAG: GNAT family N-acetyltransferase [Actinomycetota bacterium]|nr:GNAT family N-acetyltransferase [Actinomycetota bacterium]
MNVRAATEEDAEEIVRLTEAGWRVAYNGIVPTEQIENLPVSAWRHDVTSGLRSPVADSFSRIAEVDGNVVGYCYVAAPGRDEPADSRIAEVVAIYVDPKRWGNGIGRALMESVTEEVTRAGYEQMTLWTFERNAQARAFYARLGWQRDPERRPHAATGTPTIRLRHTIEHAE